MPAAPMNRSCVRDLEFEMRRIMLGETCLSATEIVQKFALERGSVLHATNAGNAARRLGLDYVEVDIEPPAGVSWTPKPERRYAELDLPAIFVELQKLADERAKWAGPLDR